MLDCDYAGVDRYCYQLQLSGAAQILGSIGAEGNKVEFQTKLTLSREYQNGILRSKLDSHLKPHLLLLLQPHVLDWQWRKSDGSCPAVQPSGNTPRGETKHGDPDNELQQPVVARLQ